MKAKIFSKIMKVRNNYAMRREKLRKLLGDSCKSSYRRERNRKLKTTSLRMTKARLVEKLMKEERKDIRSLSGTVHGSRGDLVQALMCLQEATVYINLMIRHPIMMGTPRYRKWSEALDTFLSDMRDMVDYRKKPGQHPLEVEEQLISRLKAMRIHEDHVAQKEVRFKLEDAMARLFDPRPPEVMEVRRRLMGR